MTKQDRERHSTPPSQHDMRLRTRAGHDSRTLQPFSPTATVAVVLLAVLLCPQAALAQHIRDSRSHECAAFTPTLCAIPGAQVDRSHCPNCHFEVARAFFCPLVAAGYYSYATGRSEGGGCPNPFMAQTHHLPPPCGARCCRTEHQGIFEEDEPLEEPASPRKKGSSAVIDGTLSSTPLPRQAFVPRDSTCRYKEISRGQVMRFLATHNSSLVVIGDSTMRQAFLRVVSMMRGQQRLLDYHIHTHAQYQVCREVDFLRLAANNPTGDATPSDPSFLKAQIPAFFHAEVGPGQADAKRVLSECSHPPLQMHYLQAPLFNAQREVLARYTKGLASGQHPVFLISVGFWQPGEYVPIAYLRALEDLRDAALRVIFIGVPVSNLLDSERRRQLTVRNEKIRRWVDKQGAPYSYVDFENLVAAPGAPKGTQGSKHFSCWVEWRGVVKFPTSAAGNVGGEGQLTGQPDRVHTDIPGTCADEMNRNLWQVILNGLHDSSGTQALANAEPGFGQHMLRR